MSLKRLKGRLYVFLGEANLARAISEPYIRIKVGRHVRKTGAFHGSSATPIWSEELSFGHLDEATPTMKVELREHAIIGKGKRWASVWVPVNPPPQGRTVIALAMKGEQMGTVTLEVKLDEDVSTSRSGSTQRDAPSVQVIFAPDTNPNASVSGGGGAGNGSFSASGTSVSKEVVSGNLSFSERSRAPDRRASWAPTPLGVAAPARASSPLRASLAHSSAGAATVAYSSSFGNNGASLARSAVSPGRASFHALPHTAAFNVSSSPSPPHQASLPTPVSPASLVSYAQPASPRSSAFAPASAQEATQPLAATSSAINSNTGMKNSLELYSTSSETVVWLLDHKWLGMPTLIVFLMLLSLLTIFVIVRFLRLEALLDQTLGDIAARIQVQIPAQP